MKHLKHPGCHESSELEKVPNANVLHHGKCHFCFIFLNGHGTSQIQGIHLLRSFLDQCSAIYKGNEIFICVLNYSAGSQVCWWAEVLVVLEILYCWWRLMFTVSCSFNSLLWVIPSPSPYCENIWIAHWLVKSMLTVPKTAILCWSP